MITYDVRDAVSQLMQEFIRIETLKSLLYGGECTLMRHKVSGELLVMKSMESEPQCEPAYTHLHIIQTRCR
jgi:hypothetical protein